MTKDLSIRSKEFNSNYRVKIGRTLYGYSGACALLGQLKVNHLLDRASRCVSDVFRTSSNGLTVCFYLR